MTVVVCASGTRIDLTAPDVSNVTIEDIAQALSRTARWNGASSSFLSVAEHAVIVSRFIDPRWSQEGLMHDATEALTGALVSGAAT